MGAFGYFFNKNNPKKLVEIYKNSTSKDEKYKILYKLIELEAIDELVGLGVEPILWKLKDQYVDKIYPFLIEFHRKDNKKLKELYNSSDSYIYKEKIIDILINNNANEVLWNLKDKHPSKIYPYLIKVYKSDNETLLDLLNSNIEYSDTIVDILIKNEAYKEIGTISKKESLSKTEKEKIDYFLYKNYEKIKNQECSIDYYNILNIESKNLSYE